MGALAAFSKVAENFSTICPRRISLLVSSWPSKAYYISERQFYYRIDEQGESASFIEIDHVQIAVGIHKARVLFQES